MLAAMDVAFEALLMLYVNVMQGDEVSFQEESSSGCEERCWNMSNSVRAATLPPLVRD